jgi:hypothetical protein
LPLHIPNRVGYILLDLPAGTERARAGEIRREGVEDGGEDGVVEAAHVSVRVCKAHLSIREPM